MTVVLTAGSAVVAGCASDAESAPVTCHDIVTEAAWESDVDDEVRGLDDAILQCDSYDMLYDEISSFDHMVGYSVEEFIQRRCRDEADRLGQSQVCAVAVPPTTAPELSTDLSYTGATLNGDLITVTPAEVPFVGEVPEIIAKTVAAAEQGCVSVLGNRNDYAFYANDTREGQIMSMYAQHAQSVADFLGCVSEPLPPRLPPGVTTVPGTTQP